MNKQVVGLLAAYRYLLHRVYKLGEISITAFISTNIPNQQFTDLDSAISFLVFPISMGVQAGEKLKSLPLMRLTKPFTRSSTDPSSPRALMKAEPMMAPRAC